MSTATPPVPSQLPGFLPATNPAFSSAEVDLRLAAKVCHIKRQIAVSGHRGLYEIARSSMEIHRLRADQDDGGQMIF